MNPMKTFGKEEKENLLETLEGLYSSFHKSEMRQAITVVGIPLNGEGLAECDFCQCHSQVFG